MPLFGGKQDYEIIREGEDVVLRIEYDDISIPPSIEDSPICMSTTIDKLMEIKNATKIVFHQKRDYEYDSIQTEMLLEIAKLYNSLLKQKNLFGYTTLGFDAAHPADAQRRYAEIQLLVLQLLKSDPIGAYVELKRIIRREKIQLEKGIDKTMIPGQQRYLQLLNYLLDLFDKTKLIQVAKPYLAGYKLGDREVYRKMFSPLIKPDFMFTKLMSAFPSDGFELESYTTGNDSEVTIFELPNTIQYLYHVIPPEFKLSEEKYDILDLARKIMAEHKPRKAEFVDPERMRQVFENVGHDLIEELADYKGIKLREREVDALMKILVRYTVGFGLIEILLQDEKIQDITINSPMGRTPMFIVHQDFGDCMTNIIPTVPEAESWASKLRMISGRPLDEANPILDTDLMLPAARARVAVISPPLNPFGLAYALRRHRAEPWTLPLFIKNKMLTPMAAGILSFLIDGSRTILVTGTRSSGKTSLLGSMLIEIMRKYRVITVEDSVSGDSELSIKRGGKFEKVNIGNLIDGLINKYGCWYNLSGHEVLGNDENIEIYSMDKEGKIRLSRVSKFIRHKVKKPVYKVITRTGKKLKVTEDHSLFGLKENAKISEVKVKDLRGGDFIAVPKFLPGNFKDLKCISLLDYLDKIDKGFFFGEPIKDFLKRNRFEVKQLAKERDYAICTFNRWVRIGMIPVKILNDMYCLGYRLDSLEKTYYRGRSGSRALPVLLKLDKVFLTLLGLWIADGCYDSKSIIFSVVEEENREIVKKFANMHGFNVKMHSDGFSLMIDSSTLKRVMKEILDLKGNAYTKRIPSWMLSLSTKQISYVLKGIFSGDSCISDKEVVIPLSSLNLLKDIQSLLLQFKIVFRIGKLRKDSTYNSSISTIKDLRLFKDLIGILPEYKRRRLDLLCNKVSTHDTTDVIPFVMEDKKKLCSMIKGLRHEDYITRNNNIGRVKLMSVLQETNNEFLENVSILVNSDLFWDAIREIKKINFEGYVYDISVPENESFITNNIVAHNTLELPTEALRKLGYNVQPMKVASALTRGTTEVPADEGIRTTLRMGDSCLIVGEVRSSLRGDQEVMIIEKGLTKRTAIKNLAKSDLRAIYLPTLTKENKIELKPVSGFVKHPKCSKLIKLTTKTGRCVVVTPDHSVFTHVNFKIAAINTDQLKPGDPIVIPSRIPNGFNDIGYINLVEIFKEEYRLENAEPYIRKAIKVLGWRKASEICEVADIYRYLLSTQKTRIPINSFLKLMIESRIKYDIADLRIKKGTANSIPAKFPINENTIRLIGYYLAEGNIDKDKIQITNSKPEIIEDIRYICQKEFGLKVLLRKTKGYGNSVQMSILSKPLQDLFIHFGCGKTSSYKRIPGFIYGLDKKKICALLRGMYSGDGSISVTKEAGNMIRYFSTSKKLVEDVSYALLSLGIVCRLHKSKARGRGKKDVFIAEIKQRKYIEYFLDNIGFTHKSPKIVSKSFSHSKDDSVSFDLEDLERHLKLPREYRHLRKTKCCSKDYLKRVSEEVKCSNELYDFAHGDFFIDRVKSTNVINLPKPEYVYDLEVKSTQRFIGGFGGILLHNTEARALYEAMRVGALANVVAGTIHGDSPYGVFDRVVNDLNVPRTSFKATDIIVVANPVRSADGLHRWRRVTNITEVRKFWEDDPLRENGFVDLMRYNAKTDELEPSDDLINGNSDILKARAGNVKECAGNWDAVWNNIMLRAKIKERLVNFSEKMKDPDLLEGKFVVLANDEFHKISDKIKDETGYLDSERVYFEWDEWLKRAVKRKGNMKNA